jgi:RNA polymerase sigma-70 factor (sigma-E family)
MKNQRPDPGRVRLDADFSSFVAARSGRLLHAGDLLTGSRARAEDLVQHAFAQAYLRWDSICDGNPEGYVRKVMLHAYVDWWRRVRPREFLDAGAGRAAQVPDFAPEVARRAAVQQALQKLTKRERAVVVLRYWYDLTEQQIAEELGIAPGTVKSTAARALGKLKDDVTLTARAADFNPLVESEAAR